MLTPNTDKPFKCINNGSIPKLVSIIVPVHNERENVSLMSKTIKQIFGELSYRYNLIFVDDGSSDLTLHECR